MQMSDRALLEKAARAAGIRLEWDGNPTTWAPMYYDGKTYRYWSPLESGEDALRLAVRLGLFVATLYHSGDGMVPGTGVLRPDKPFPPEFWLPHGDDPEAVTKRAITTFAAKISR